MIFQDSALAHRFLDGAGTGIEIGPGAHNPFHIAGTTIFVGLDDPFYRQAQVDMCGTWQRLDVQAHAEALPFADGSLAYVLSSHVFEHVADPIRVLKEWWSVLRPGGYIFAIVPHRMRTFDRDRERTTLTELVHRYTARDYPDDEHGQHHCSVWETEDLVELAGFLGYPLAAVQDVDDKVGNGMTIVLRKG